MLFHFEYIYIERVEQKKDIEGRRTNQLKQLIVLLKMPRSGYNTKFKMSAKELGVLTVVAGKAGMLPMDYLLKMKVDKNEITTKENAVVDEEVSQLTEDTMLELDGGKRKRSDSVDTCGPTPKKLDTRESPTIVLKRWIQEGRDIGWPGVPVEKRIEMEKRCHGCGHKPTNVRLLMWYDTNRVGTQLCGSCDMIFYDEYIKHRVIN